MSQHVQITAPVVAWQDLLDCIYCAMNEGPLTAAAEALRNEIVNSVPAR